MCLPFRTLPFQNSGEVERNLPSTLNPLKKKEFGKRYRNRGKGYQNLVFPNVLH